MAGFHIICILLHDDVYTCAPEIYTISRGPETQCARTCIIIFYIIIILYYIIVKVVVNPLRVPKPVSRHRASRPARVANVHGFSAPNPRTARHGRPSQPTTCTYYLYKCLQSYYYISTVHSHIRNYNSSFIIVYIFFCQILSHSVSRLTSGVVILLNSTLDRFGGFRERREWRNILEE